jgi:hypothetical protein
LKVGYHAGKPDGLGVGPKAVWHSAPTALGLFSLSRKIDLEKFGDLHFLSIVSKPSFKVQ